MPSGRESSSGHARPGAITGCVHPKFADPNIATSKKTTGPSSVKQLVRSLSDRYGSPLSRKKNTTSGNAGRTSSATPALKMMKTTAATSMLPLRPSLTSTKRQVSARGSTRPATAAKEVNDTADKLIDSQMQGLPRANSLVCSPLSSMRASSASVHQVKGRNPVVASSPPMATGFSKEKRPSSVPKHFQRESSAQEEQLTDGVPFLLDRHSHGLDCRLSHFLATDNERRPDLRQLEALFKFKDEELDGLRATGLMLKELCMRQDEEIKLLKAAFQPTLKEMALLRQACEKHEKDLAQAQSTVPALEEQVAALVEQMKCLAKDVAEMKDCKQMPSRVERLHQQSQPLEVASSRCSVSTIAMEAPSPDTSDGYPTAQLRGSGAEENLSTLERNSEAASSSCSGSNLTTDYQSEITPVENRSLHGKHRRGFSAVLSTDKTLKGSGKCGRFMTDKELSDTLQALNSMADKEQAMLQERCANAYKDLRSSSSRFASLEPLKSILTWTSPYCYRDDMENEGVHVPVKLGKMGADMWSLRPT